jgi:hypothetical protein
MEKLVAVAVGAAWLAILIMLIWGIVSGVRRQLRHEGPPPLFAVLQGHGLAVSRVEQVAGVEQLARAVGRCSLCRETAACGTRDCPNDELLRRIR